MPEANVIPLRIGVVAGEASGDLLGARLVQSLQRHLPNARFEGVCGPEMKALGCKSLFPMERLSVMGLTEVLGSYFDLRRARSEVIRHFRDNPPDLFIGIDSPGFNLGVEHALKQAGIPTVHYVSPQVWAWRTWRVKKIRESVDLMLTLFPFEEEFYRTHGVPARFAGHPLADEIQGDSNTRGARDKLKLSGDGQIVALMPGSRVTELKALADLFIKTALWLHQRNPDLQFVVPFVNRATLTLFEEAVKRNEAWDLPLTRVHGHSRVAIAAADVVLLASGTATLEALLLRRPMVVTYRVSSLSYWLIRKFSHIKLYAMPNHLAGSEVVPEILQDEATPVRLGSTVERFLRYPGQSVRVMRAYEMIHAQLRSNSSELAAKSILELLQSRAARVA
jgi:lipid-A-disaccharide synthase